MNEFLGRRGAGAGNTSSVYYGSYVFFEKVRIRDGKAKRRLGWRWRSFMMGGSLGMGRRGWMLSIGVGSTFKEFLIEIRIGE